jgi:hypothetical protein
MMCVTALGRPQSTVFALAELHPAMTPTPRSSVILR